MLDPMAEGKTSPLTENSPADNQPTALPPTNMPPSSEESSDQGKQAGELFLEWVRDSIENGTLSINEKDSLLHVLAQFVFLVSPACFYRYTTTVEGSCLYKDSKRPIRDVG